MWPRSRRKKNQGAIMVEALAGILFLLILGIGSIDYGLILRDKQLVVQAVSVTGRAASLQVGGLDLDTLKKVARTFVIEANQDPGDFTIQFTDPGEVDSGDSIEPGKFLQVVLTRVNGRTIWMHAIITTSSESVVAIPESGSLVCNENLGDPCA